MQTLSKYFIFGVLFFIGCGQTESDFKEFSRYYSPDNTLIVTVSTGQAKLAYGPTTVKINLINTDTDSICQIVTTKIANDGVPLSDKNIAALWTNRDTLRLCLSGDEQQDEQIEIKLTTASYSSSTGECLE